MKKILLLLIFLGSILTAKAQYLILLSPNGGETFAIGSSLNITWASLAVSEVDIEYSNDNGNTFTTIGTNLNAYANSYSWIVTGPITSQGRIRIKESTNGILTDTSTSNFNVVNPSIQITSPTAGQIFNPAQIVNIAWVGNLVSNNVNILFSSNNGSNYDTVITNTPNFYNYDWTVPPVASQFCKIKVIDAATSLVQNESPVFTIEALPSSATILAPNGGENLFSTNYFEITWNVNGTSIVDLEYSSDGGTNWQIITQNLAATPSTYNWLIPSLNSSTVKVRIKNAINGLVLDQSNNNFSITQPTPTLYLASPFGFENWAVGSTQSIQWTYTFINNIKIEYSIDGGANFNLISANTLASDLSYDWIVPAGVSNNCIIRISDNNSSNTSQNQFPFSIVNPNITLLSPNGGEIFNSNVDTLISWNGTIVSNLIKIEYSTNNGTSWNLIVDNWPNSNYYYWTVPNTPSVNCKIRISDALSPAVSDQSNAVFTITPPIPTINLALPNGGEIWANGTYQTIFWTANNIANVKIEISSDSGATWSIIDPLVLASLGSYSWQVNATVSINTLIKVSDASNTSVNDISAGVFEIYQPTAFIDLLYPNNGEQIASGVSVPISWNSLSVNTVAIEYSLNNGLNWQVIATNVPASLGVFNWLVPNNFSNSVKIRIRDDNNISIFDQSAGVFSIISPTIEFSGFPVGSNYDLFSNINLLWVSTGLNNQLLRLEYSINNGLNWVTFASGLQNNGLYNWTINCPPNNNCLIKISVESNPSINAITTGPITINPAGQSLIILTPTANEFIASGNIYPITWNSYGFNYVRIEYSLNGDTIFQLITPFAPANTGLFNWNVPVNVNASNCKIKISNAANTNISTITPNGFNIQMGSINILTSNFTSVLFAGNNLEVLWSHVSTSPYVQLDYSTDSINWINIVSNYSNSGSYVWTIPYINSNSVWFKVQDQLNPAIFDVNDMQQIIQITDSLLQIISPSDGSILLGGSIHNITWEAYGFDFVDIDFSDDNGLTWNTIATNVVASNQSYDWQVPNTNTSNARIRIKNSNFPSQFSENQTPFNISDYFLNITSPNGGEMFNTGTNQYITWQTLGIDFINLYYSIDGGSSFITIDTNIFNIGYYNWQIPNSSASNCKIKIMDSNNQFLFDESDLAFSIVTPNQSINLISPNGGEQWYANNAYYIAWQSTGIANVDISYSLDAGATFTAIATNFDANLGFYYWLVPDTFSNNVKIKIISSGNSTLNDISNSNFSIINNTQQITLISPNGNEVFNSGSYQMIKWQSSNVPYAKIYYSTNGGVSFNYISALLHDSIFIWQVPAVNSNSCRIKIENGNDPSIFDISDAVFTISNLPLSSNTIHIDSMATNIFCAGANVTIPFSTSGSFNSNNHFRVQLSDPLGNFNSFTDIGGIMADSSSTIQCSIPTQLLSSNLYTIRIVADDPVATSLNYTYGNITLSKANADFISDKQLVLFPNTEVNFSPVINSNASQTNTWNTGNGGIYNSFNAQHIYNLAGKYDISHTLTDTLGCTSTMIKSRYISAEHWFQNTLIESNTLNNIADIAFENDRYGCAVLKNGNCIVSSDSGKTWTLRFTNTNNINLNAVTIFENVWYLAAENGSYYKSSDKGNSWIEFTFNNNESLNDIKFISQNSAYAIGNNGKLIKYNGSVWQNQNAGTNKKLNKIAINNNSVIVVGNEGTILKKQNNTWLSISSPTNVNINSICLKDSTIGYLACDFGFILKTSDGGNTWNVSLSGADVNFNDIVCNNDTVWAIATDGIIYTSINNGATWNRYSIGELSDLNSIIYQNNKGYIVGNNGLLRTFNKPNFVSVVNNLSNTNLTTDIICFPNPSSDYVTINFNNTNIGQTYIVLSDLHGKIIYESEIKDLNSSGQIMVDLKNYHDGVYFLTVVNNSIYQTFKVVKTK